MRPSFLPASWTSSGPLRAGYDACGVVFGVIRSPYKARFRFYKGDERETYIQWYFAPPGASYYFGQTPIHPFRHKYTYDPLGPGEVGELDSPLRRFNRFPAPSTVEGVTPDATADELAGLATLPDYVLPDGTIPPEKLPACATPLGIVLDADATAPSAGIALGAFSQSLPLAGVEGGLSLAAFCNLPAVYQSAAHMALLAQMPYQNRFTDGGGMADGVARVSRLRRPEIVPGGGMGDGNAAFLSLRMTTGAGGGMGDGSADVFRVRPRSGIGGGRGDGTAAWHWFRIGEPIGGGSGNGTAHVHCVRTPAPGVGGGMADGEAAVYHFRVPGDSCEDAGYASFGVEYGDTVADGDPRARWYRFAVGAHETWHVTCSSPGFEGTYNVYAGDCGGLVDLGSADANGCTEFTSGRATDVFVVVPGTFGLGWTFTLTADTGGCS